MSGTTSKRICAVCDGKGKRYNPENKRQWVPCYWCGGKGWTTVEPPQSEATK